MPETIEVKTAELIGPTLDWAVAQVEGVNYRLVGLKCRARLTARTWHHYTKPNFSPSTDWSQCGPLIAKHLIDFTVEHPTTIGAALCDENGNYISTMMFAETHLIAACRAIVQGLLGDTVQIPAELTQPLNPT
jgi:hypothetical protein